MKSTILITGLLFISLAVIAQAPGVFKYQAVARDNQGNPITNQLVSFQIDIVQGDINGMSIYSESHNDSTNKFGIVNLEIGNGATVDNFESIDWSNGIYFIQISFV